MGVSARLSAALVAAVLLLAAGEHAMGQTGSYSLTLASEDQSYVGPAFITLSGAIFPPPPSQGSVDLFVLAPDGSQVESLDVSPASDGNFSATFVGGGGADWTDGAYLAVANYSGSSAHTSFLWAPAPPSTFSIFWITDTQFLSETNEGLFANTTAWIADHWDQYNGKMVVLTGDIAEDAGTQGEYANASDAMSVLLDAGIPYTWDAGNHDDLTTDPPTWLGANEPGFNATDVGQVVNATGYSHWVGSFDGGMDTAVNFTADGLGFLIVNLEFNADPQALSWAGGLLADPTYSNDDVIVATHAYINATGSLNDPKWGPILADFTASLTSLMDGYYPRVILTMNGHFNNAEGYHTPSPVDGRYEIMFDRQDCTGLTACNSTSDTSPPHNARVGASTVTILTFNTLSDDLGVRSFEVFEGQYLNDSNDQYMLPGIFNGASNVTTATVTSTTTATSTTTLTSTTTAPAQSVTITVTTTLAPKGPESLAPSTYAVMAVLACIGVAAGYVIRRTR